MDMQSGWGRRERDRHEGPASLDLLEPGEPELLEEAEKMGPELSEGNLRTRHNFGASMMETPS